MPEVGLGQVKVEDSLKKRYLYKLSANGIGLLMALVTQAIIPRALGPTAYGSFSFLSTFFSQVVSSFDCGTSLGFYNKLAQRPHESGLLRFYWGLTSLVSLVVVLFVTGVFAIRLEHRLWPEQEARYVWMAVAWGLLTWYAEVLNKVVDAYGLTVGGEIARTQQRVLSLCLILLMFWLSQFTLTEFFLYHYLILLFLYLVWWRVLRREGIALFPTRTLPAVEVKRYSREFYEYSAPLVGYIAVSLLTGVPDRWLLQKFAGSVEQGFYGLSYQVGALCFLFTNAMTPLLMREFSKAFGDHDLDHMRALFLRYIPMLYSIAAFFGMFVAVQAHKVGLIFGGDQFQGAAVAISIMALYPIHQTYGQLSGSVFYATGQTRLYRNIGMSTMLLGLPVTLWLVAPRTWSGLDLGATGLAVKTVVLQFIGVNLQLWFNTRLLQVSFWRMLWHQAYSVAAFAGIAWLAAAGVDPVIRDPLWALFTSGLLYALGCLALVFAFPPILSSSRAELRSHVTQLKLKMIG